MIKIVFSEVESPTTPENAIDLNRSSGFRAVNLATKHSTIFIINENGDEVSLSLVKGESVHLKKELGAKVYSSSGQVRISGVSIY